MTLPARTKHSVLIITLLLGILSAFIIFYRFTSIPKTLTFDEIEFAKLALSLDNHSYIPYSPLATGHSTLYFYILLFSLKVFGINSFGLRFPAALFGLASVLVLFFVLRRVVQKMEIPHSHSPFLHNFLPVVGTFLFATTRWYFNFTRFGFEATFVLLLELISLLFLLIYLDHKQKKWLIPSGIFAGLAYNSYQPGRLFFIIPLIFLFLFILERKQHRLDFSFFTKYTVTTFLSFLIPFIVLITPLSLYLSQNKDVRVNQLMYPTNTELTLGEKFQFFGRNVASTALMFSVKGDVNGRHNYPNKAALNPLMSLLFMSGLLLALWKIKQKMNQLFVIYFFLAISPTLLTYPWENPNMLRTITCLPSLIYFCMFAIAHIYIMSEKRFHIYYKILVIGIFIGIIVSAVYDARTYFMFQAPVFKEAFEAQMPLSYYINNPDAKVKK
ncbi:MAG: glycosyltransferase family 39 protein [Candidatus Roizmanbacteria bacterium]|nr:glycosyltransferase family 39 protein [Candidatus Roizmanbacteria bacterium]